MSKRIEVTNAIIGLLKKKVPEANWNASITGVNRSSKLEGTVTCDRIEYNYEAYDVLTAKAVYSIYIVDMNSIEGVDDIADKAFVLLNNSDLAGTITEGLVSKIIYGTAQGKQNAGVALLEYVVEYEEE